MKKLKKVLMTFLPSLFVFGMVISLPASGVLTPIEEDTAIYGEEGYHVDFAHPDIRNYAAGDEEEEDEDVKVEVDKVILHYYNEAGGCDGRAFYLWVTGEDGVEYNLDNASDIFKVSDDKTMMEITIDFLNDARFSAFKNRSGLYFIVKFKKISDTNLNWGGQSDDTLIRYADFPESVNEEKVCELWSMPAAGGGIAVLDSEAKTKVHGVALAQFTDWKTIQCTLTADTTTVNWKLYAFDETYYKTKAKKRAEIEKWYLVKEGQNTGNFNIQLKYEAHVNVVYSLVSHDPSTDSQEGMADLNKVATVSFEKLYFTEKFHQHYENVTKDLGATYSKEGTTFRVWSPTSANMTVLVYDVDTSAEYALEEQKEVADKYKGFHMQYTSGGVWEVTIDGDLSGKYYNYQVDNTLGTNVCMDPYATSAGANGLRGFIYDKAATNPEKWDELPLKWDGDSKYDLATPQDLTIYEVHVQDFTGDSSWISNKGNKNGTFNAFVESGTRLKGETGNEFWKTTGYDHLNGLGVSAVQIMPMFDHDNDEVASPAKYNWGYNPLNYNVIEGSYSSNPHDGAARVKEFKNMVYQLAQTEAHTRVIMDVVYNHVSSATGSCFHKLMPRYYFRYAQKDHTYYWKDSEGNDRSSTVPAGELWDGSGCHNEVASERPMMRKFIVDSLKMWASEYKVKGFRFDLMGLIDYQTMNEARKALYEIDPDIYLYGEGWTSDGYHGEGSGEWNEENPGVTSNNYGAFTWQVYNECNVNKAPGVYLGGFSDSFRNAVRGGNDAGAHYPGAGWIQKGNWPWGNSDFDYETLNKVTTGIWGMNYDVNGNGTYGNGDKTGCFPEQTVNYVSCHDNFTLRDQLFQTLLNEGKDPSKIAESLLRASIQGHALTMAGNAAAFILGGEEFLRTKTLSEANVEYVKKVAPDSYVGMYGNYVSHNSYNSPFEVNTFKWDNKKSITVTGEKDGTEFSSTITNAEFNYCDSFASLIKMHKGIEKVRSTSSTKTIYDVMGDLGSRWWSRNGQDDLSNCIAIRMNKTLIFAAVGPISIGADNEYLGCNPDELDTALFEYGAKEWKDTYHLFPKDYNMILVSKTK